MLGGGVFVKQNKKLPGSFVNFQTNQQNDSSNNDCFGKGGIPDTCREVIEARGNDKTLKDRLDRMEAQKGGDKILSSYEPNWNNAAGDSIITVDTPVVAAQFGVLTNYTVEGE